jgi:hypothetical protein
MSFLSTTATDKTIQNAAHYSENYGGKESFSGTNEMKKKGFMSKLFSRRKLPEEPKKEEEVKEEEEVVVEEAVEEEVEEEEVEE